MRAATIVNRSLQVTEVADPVPGAGELLVRVRSAGLNSADLMQVAGGYPAPPGAPQDIPGLELAGEVVSTGPGVHRFRVGDRVMAVVGGGAQAELAVFHERTAMPIPEELDWAAAGGFPEAFTTAHDAVFTQCGLRMGERLLVHGAAGGVGSAAVQLGLAAGADVIATVRSPERRGDVAALGAVALPPEDFEAHGPFDVVLELIGAPNMAANIRALTIGGRIAIIGVGGGAAAEISLLGLMQKRATIHASTLRARPLEQKAAAARAVEAQALPAVRQGRLQVPIAATFALGDIAAAYDTFRAGSKFGKIVVLP